MGPLKKYFSLYEISLLSLCGALIFVLKMIFKIPVQIPGHTAILWVIPMMLGIGIVRKFGAGTYIGLISGILVSFFGMDAFRLFDIFEYLAMGITMDILAVVFAYHFENPAVGFIVGAGGSLVKMMVNYSVQLFLGIPGAFILLGIGIASVSHIIFGGLGGIIAALVIARLLRAGVISREHRG
jgi:hypothetical protein